MSVSSTHEQKIQSLQHSLLFLQQEHAKTLAGLRQEIEKLQSKCSELTFQLAQQDGVPVRQASDTESSLKGILENEIRQLRQENKSVKTSLEIKDKRISLLEGQLKSKEQKHGDDLKNTQRKIRELQLDLEQKSTTIAYLTTQLHQIRINKNSKFGDLNSAEDSSENYSPSPPRGNPPDRRRYNLRRAATSPAANVSGMIQERSSHQLIATDHVLENSLPKTNTKRYSSRYKQSITDPPRPAVGHSHAKRERELRLATNTKPKPTDYEDFIAISQSQEIITAKTSIEPLPPITTRSGRQLRDSLHNIRTRPGKIKPTANSSGEVETIILENKLTSPELSYRKLPQNSTK